MEKPSEGLDMLAKLSKEAHLWGPRLLSKKI